MSSHASTPNSPSPSPSSPANILTPSRKVAALLAEFDSDSDNDDGADLSQAQRPSLAERLRLEHAERERQDAREASRRETGVTRSERVSDAMQVEGEGSESDDDDIVFAPRGRMAARLQGAKMDGSAPEAVSETSAESTYERLKKMLVQREEKEGGKDTAMDDESEPEEDEVALPKARRRLGKAKATVIDDEEDEEEQRVRSTPSTPGSQRLFLSASPSPNISSRHADVAQTDDDSDAAAPADSSRFMALVAKKRAERQAKEAEERKKREARAALAKSLSDDIDEDMDDLEDEDPEAGRKLTQHAKPTRKAGKKAMEEINRESQRIKRNMQLAHQAKTKKKITKESFFSRFNLGGSTSTETAQQPATSSSAPTSETEGQHEHVTPPTSPVQPADDRKKTAELDAMMEPLAPLPPTEVIETRNITLDEAVAANDLELEMPKWTAAEKGKGKAVEEETVSKKEKKNVIVNPAIRVRISREMVKSHNAEGDDDLDIVTSPSKTRRYAIFENLGPRKAAEAHSLLMLRGLAHLTSPSKTRNKRGPSSVELEFSLRQQARLQAAREREERIQELRDRGIIIQTAEEREKEQAEVEDLVEKARLEAEGIAKKEKEDAKRDGKEVDDGLSGDESEDEDYVGDEEEEADVELSGSEEEGDSGDDEAKGFFEQEAGEDASAESSAAEEEEDAPAAPARRRAKNTRVVSDDEDDAEETIIRSTPLAPRTPRGLNIPGLGQHDDGLSFGLTQAFASTAQGSQSPLMGSAADEEQDSLAMLRQMPDPGLPVADLLDDIVMDSQPIPDDNNDFSLNLADFKASHRNLDDSPGMRTLTQYSQIPGPSQDGFEMSPLLNRQRGPMPQSTVETVLVERDESPIVKRKGKLLRRRLQAADSSDESEGEGHDDGFEISASAFDVMRSASAKEKKRRAQAAYDKEKSRAKEAVDEAAVESEDEYAGLGGASDDDNGLEENEEDRMMIDDDKEIRLGERQIAALHADKERQQDEAQVSKLLKDITSGALRRKRGANGAGDIDLDDSDDDIEARRRAKRREFAKMRKALLAADEKIGVLAENPKKAAFMKSIEDVMDDDDDFEIEEEASQENENSTQDSNVDAAASSDKRPLQNAPGDLTNRRVPFSRRRQVLKKPSTLAEIRESVSFLIDDPHSMSNSNAASDEEDEFMDEVDENGSGSQSGGLIDLVTETSIEDNGEDLDDDLNDFIVDDEQEDSNGQSSRPLAAPPRAHFSARRTTTTATSVKLSTSSTTMPAPPTRRVIDRLSLLRAASSNSSISSTTKTAFASTTADTTFRVPALLARRATGEFAAVARSMSNGSESGTGTKTGGGAAAGAKKASVNYYARARDVQRSKELGSAEVKGKKKSAGKGGVGLGALMGGGDGEEWE